MSVIELNGTQQTALRNVDKWISGNEGKQIYALAGYAGTGKSVLARNILRMLKGKKRSVVPAAPTGVAAYVMASKGIEGAQTLDKVLFVHEPVPEYDQNGDPLFDRHGDPVVRRFVTRPKTAGEFDPNTVFMIDEASMLRKDMARQLLVLGFPVLTIYDPQQLAPPGTSPTDPDLLRFAPSLAQADTVLADIMRQSDGTGHGARIVKAAMRLRHDDATVLSVADAYDIPRFPKFSSKYDKLVAKYPDMAIICATNSQVINHNNRARQLRGFNPNNPLFQKGEPIQVVQNQYRVEVAEDADDVQDAMDVEDRRFMYAANGQGAVVASDPVWVKGEAAIECDVTWDMSGETTREHFMVEDLIHDESHPLYLAAQEEQPCGRTRAFAIKATLAHAMTCHKSQGREFTRVLIALPPNLPDNRWSYTALTRASENVAICK